MLTSFDDNQALLDAVMAGASGYVIKQIRGSDLVGAVRTVAAGQSMLDPHATSQLMARLRDRTAKADPLAMLTSQERRILELIGEGLTNRQIGERMYLAEKTVKNSSGRSSTPSTGARSPPPEDCASPRPSSRTTSSKSRCRTRPRCTPGWPGAAAT